MTAQVDVEAGPPLPAERREVLWAERAYMAQLGYAPVAAWAAAGGAMAPFEVSAEEAEVLVGLGQRSNSGSGGGAVQPWGALGPRGALDASAPLAARVAARAETHPDALGAAVRAFLDTANTSMGRATFYNSKAEQEAAEVACHRLLRALDRGVYTMLLLAPGTLDRARQVGLLELLGNPRDPARPGVLTAQEEGRALAAIAEALPVARRMRTWGMIRAARVNNARARKLVLRALLGHPRLELWCVRYRAKVRDALVHAWGRRTASALRSLVGKPAGARAAAEAASLRAHIDRFAGERDPEAVYACVGFALGLEVHGGLRLLRAYFAARERLDAGRVLPFETLAGIRSTYHKDTPLGDVLAATQAQLTDGQRLNLQKTAARHDVEVEVDYRRADAVRLVLQALNVGADAALRAALDAKVRQLAVDSGLRFGRVAVIVDASASMRGDRTQALRPIATALVLRDVLRHTADTAHVWMCGGDPLEGDAERVEAGLVRPSGASRLARALVDALKADPDAVFVLSDGYENAPAGRVDAVLSAARRLGVRTPVLQLSPVFAAEAAGVRALSEAHMPALPIARPEALGLSWLQAALVHDPKRALVALAEQLAPHLDALAAPSGRA